MTLTLLVLSMVACVKPDGDTQTKDPTGPLGVTGFGDDVEIASHDGDSQAEPSTVALPDGTVIASWMQLDGYTLYINYARSTDNGATWSDAKTIDEDRWGYQNDPVLVQGGGYIYFTWLAVEGSNYDKSSIYCVDSTDGGETWSDKVTLTEANTFNDRQWMAVDDTGRAVVTWDLFNSSYTKQAYSVTEGGCAGFAEAEVIANGSFLNGVPAIGADGTIYTSRAEYDYGSEEMQVIVATEDGGDFHDEVVFSQDVPYEVIAGRTAENPQEEHEETMEGIERAEEGEAGEVELDLDELRVSPGMERALVKAGTIQPKRLASAGFDGFYSPVLQPLPDNSIAIVTCAFEDGSDDTPDVYYITYDGEASTDRVLNQDSTGIEQMEPWMVVDKWGGIHVSWFDAREDEWRLYGATSVDGGETFSEYTIADDTFRKGFDDYDTYAWVGHFQGLTASDDHVIAVWGDSSEDATSRLMADTSVGR